MDNTTSGSELCPFVSFDFVLSMDVGTDIVSFTTAASNPTLSTALIKIEEDTLPQI